MTPERWKKIELLYHAALESEESHRGLICTKFVRAMMRGEPGTKWCSHES